MLGSTDGGARIAGPLGIPFVFAHHFHPHFTEPALELYRELFVPSDLTDHPRTIVAAAVVVGEDDEHAARLALPGGVSMLRLRQGRPAPLPSVDDAEALIERLSPAERAVVEETIARAIVGGPETVRSQLLELVERTGTDELMITSQVADVGTRIRGLEHVARAFELTPQPVG
jgi:luciferase family oxidoreductase group 1